MTAGGLDLRRGRPTPAVGTTEAKLQQRKLDALRRGVHRVSDPHLLPFGVHVIGVGGAGVGIVEQMLRDAPADLLAPIGSRFTALAIDIGNPKLEAVQSLASRFGMERAQVDTLSLPIPQPEVLAQTLKNLRRHLELEYPMLQGSGGFEPWLDQAMPMPANGDPVPRALAKAVYSQAYYEGDRPMVSALKRFAESANATQGDSVVCIVFGLGGGVGSGMALDLARHLSSTLFGRRMLVMGIGIGGCEGDAPERLGAQLFTCLNELDSLCDEGQNAGVVQACGELYKNPFTAGFLMVPQQPVFARTGRLEASWTSVDREVAALLTRRQGANLWELLRLLNWVAAPSTQHSAARTPWGAKWLHVLCSADPGDGPAEASRHLADQLGVLPSYAPEFIEVRVAEKDDAANRWASAIDATFAPEAAASIATGGAEESIQFVLPRVGKADLGLFFDAREAYDRQPPAERLLAHSLLLERGVVLCEPSTRIDGMAGAGLKGGSGWVAVPFERMRGPAQRPAPASVESNEGVSHAA